MKTICRHSCHKKIPEHHYFREMEFDTCECHKAMRAAKYINEDGTIDPDVYAEASIQTNYEHRKASFIEYYPVRKKRK